MATLRIGGRDIEVPQLNFKSIKLIWPLVSGVTESEDMVELADAASHILSIALARSDTPLTVDEIEDQLLGSELAGLQKSIEDLLIESGLLQRVGEGDITVGEAPAATASTEIGTDSSQSLSPQDVPVETGNA